MPDKSKKICTFANSFVAKLFYFFDNKKRYAMLLRWKPRKFSTLNSQGIWVTILRL